MPGQTPASVFGGTYSSADMPISGQQALVNFVKAGGGLVTGEELTDRSGSPFHAFQTLSTALPAMPSTINTGNVGLTFSSLTNDPILNKGLPSTFSFSGNTNFGITETYFLPKPGATPLFTTNQWTSSFGGYGTAYGAVAWNYGQGRVISLSTMSNNTELADPNYAQLLRNAANWATDSAGTPPVESLPLPPPTTAPEPATLIVVGLGIVGFLGSRRFRG